MGWGRERRWGRGEREGGVGGEREGGVGRREREGGVGDRERERQREGGRERVKPAIAYNNNNNPGLHCCREGRRLTLPLVVKICEFRSYRGSAHAHTLEEWERDDRFFAAGLSLHTPGTDRSVQHSCASPSLRQEK